MIFRFDRREIEKALIAAANRGVSVHALIAYTNRGGEKSLRALEMRLLESGITVARTADDLVRYHAKMIIIDKRELFVLGFNFSLMDIDHSRSFGVVTTQPKFVREAIKLFEADMKRQVYAPGYPAFVVSPHNAREALSAFIAGAKRELLIYDPKIGDAQMIRLLEERAAAGVQIRILGRITRSNSKLSVNPLTGIRLHTRTFLRDGKLIFVGSQSLRTAELDARREVGIIFSDPKCVSQFCKIFEADWKPVASGTGDGDAKYMNLASSKVAKKVAKAVTKRLRPVGAVLAEIMKDASGPGPSPDIDMEELEASVRETVVEAVREVVQAAVDDRKDGKQPAA
jgi:phosphatidylserine/phosphatidylglycerophosphate/cardiolipin synthase-like enzyme